MPSVGGLSTVALHQSRPCAGKFHSLIILQWQHGQTCHRASNNLENSNVIMTFPIAIAGGFYIYYCHLRPLSITKSRP